tara:strand:- start:5458 stop:6132 length:675 start_codon:yes stop_codon:yes gene_type:complete
MIVINNDFELQIPRHIKFTLYKHDYIDNLIMSRVKKECKNLSNNPNVEFELTLESFEAAMKTSAFLLAELRKLKKDDDYIPAPDFKPNSVYFLRSIIDRLPNLERIIFKTSNAKQFSRLVKTESGKQIVSFHFNIIEGIFDLTQILDRQQLDTFNIYFIEIGILKNKYLERESYFYIHAHDLFDIIADMDSLDIMETIELITAIDPKIEEDNPVLLVKTDYTPY